MQRRASKQRLNRKIRKKIAEINREIEAHCARLCEQEWQELCDTMDGNMSAGRTWKILRHLLDPNSTRTATRVQMAKLRHKYKDDPEAFAEEIVQTHLARPAGQSCCGRPSFGHSRHDEGGDSHTDVPKIRVLGLWLEENGANRELVARLQKKVAAATHLVRRVAKKRKGLKEHNVTKLIHAYALSHIAYVAAYADWNRSETDKLNVADPQGVQDSPRRAPVHRNP
ncbi:hypothetical protein MTO96_042481 [Rhipicephalus appendiculatus]